MQLYRFFDPSAYGADKCVLIVSATGVKAIDTYLDKYHPNCKGIHLSKDVHRNNVVVMSISQKILQDGVVSFHPIVAIEIS